MTSNEIETQIEKLEASYELLLKIRPLDPTTSQAKANVAKRREISAKIDALYEQLNGATQE